MVVMDSCCDCTTAPGTYRSCLIVGYRSPLAGFHEPPGYSEKYNPTYRTATFTVTCSGLTDTRVWRWNIYTQLWELTSSTVAGAAAALENEIATHVPPLGSGDSYTDLQHSARDWTYWDEGLGALVLIGTQSCELSEEHTNSDLATEIEAKLVDLFESAFAGTSEDQVIDARQLVYDTDSSAWTFPVDTSWEYRRGYFAQFTAADGKGDTAWGVFVEADLGAYAGYSTSIAIRRVKVRRVPGPYCRFIRHEWTPDDVGNDYAVDVIAGDATLYFTPLPTIIDPDQHIEDGATQLHCNRMAEDLDYAYTPPWINEQPSYPCPFYMDGSGPTMNQESRTMDEEPL